VFAGPLGEIGRVVLGIGMWAAVLTSYLGSNMGYGLIVADTYEQFVRGHAGEDDESVRDSMCGRAYRVLLVLFCLPPLYVLFTSWQPFWVLTATSAMFLVLTPAMMVGLWLMTGNRTLMGDHVNGVVSRITTIAAIVFTRYLSYESTVELIGSL